MDSVPHPTAPIQWDRVRERLPATAAELLAEVRHVYEASADDAPRAIDRALRARLADLRRRFEAVSEREP